MGKVRQFLTELSAYDTIMARYYRFTFLLLLELHTLDLLRNFASYTWHSRVCVSVTYSFQDNNLKLAAM